MSRHNVDEWLQRRSVVAILTASLWLPAMVSAQTSFEWLTDAVHPRGMALANATVADADPAEALGLNPAGLQWAFSPAGSTRLFQLGLRRYPADITQQVIQVVFPAGEQLVGIEIRHFDYGTFYGYDDDGRRQEDYTAGDLLLRSGLRHMVGRYLAVGVAVGMLSSQLEAVTARALVWSLGVQLEVVPLAARLGVVVQNRGRFTTLFGNTLPDELPGTWLVGLAKSLAYLPFTLYISAGQNVADSRLLWRLGGEFRLHRRLVLRFGVDQGKTDYRRGNAYADLFSGFCLGFGTSVGEPDLSRVTSRKRPMVLALDGAAKLLGPLGFSTSVALGLRF
ncbi:MAG: hypothetical protein ACETWG_07215 [Candidatus Neomarinimicrobiota bacterium]